jgi:fatty-acyl-CoA synthase
MATPDTVTDTADNLFRALERTVRDRPLGGITLLDNRGRPASRRTFGEIVAAAQLTARRLAALGVAPEERLLLCLPTSWEWIDAWLGAQYLGARPVAIAPPGALGSPTAQVEKTLRVAQRLGAKLLIGSDAVLREARSALAGGIEERSLGAPLLARLVEADELSKTAPAAALPVPDARPEEVAFFQLTSGSTGLPRAVAISHRAVLHNSAAMLELVTRPHGRPVGDLVSWLPLYHDMGLVGFFLNCLVAGIEGTLMSPRTFLARPWLWLETISRCRDVLSPGPNFAYQLCSERIDRERMAGLDLRRWRDAITGSEMVRPETGAAFCDHFESAGFTPGQLRASYGLAETTLCVTMDCRSQGLRTRPLPPGAHSTGAGSERREVVSNGVPVPDTEVAIVAPDGRRRPPLQIGSVRVRGPGVMSGYLDDPEANKALQDGWLDTGDLGFLDSDGELYLTGRTKEILILHGQNLMPHDLEWLAEGVAASGGSERAGAFSIPGQTGEQAVLVVETADAGPEQIEALRHDVARAIGRTLSVPIADLVLVRRGTIPRTSSGKIQRAALREMYLRGELAPFYRSRQPD